MDIGCNPQGAQGKVTDMDMLHGRGASARPTPPDAPAVHHAAAGERSASALQASGDCGLSMRRQSIHLCAGTPAPGAAAAPAPVVNTSFSAVVVQSKEAALAGLKSAEGQAFIIETIEQNGSTVAKIVGVK